MNAKMIVFGLVISLFSIAISIGASNMFFQKKIAFVRSQDLIFKYEGTKEAMAKFNDQKETWQANVDTLKVDFQRAVLNYNKTYEGLSAQERQLREKDLSGREIQLQNYATSVDTKIKKADEEMMQEVLDQINVFIKEYSVEKGYDVVLGSTVSGNVLYGEETLDITEELLEALNKHYKGE